MKGNVYINRTASFLPGPPITNDKIEDVLGMINGLPSRAKRTILKNNGINSRYYSIDRTGELKYTNAQLTAEAVRRLADREFLIDDIEVLSCGTSSPDQIFPNHASMVHGELGSIACETSASSGVCLSGIIAMKYSYMAVAAGLCDNAVATGSEVASTFLHARNFTSEVPELVDELETRPELAFEKDFLRWMLSDGAGAVHFSNKPNSSGLSFRVDWIEMRSYASEMETCMFVGAIKGEDGRLRGWRDFPSLEEAVKEGAFSIRQDVKLLNENVTAITVSRGLSDILKKHHLKVGDVNWFLPHYSSKYFRSRVQESLRAIDFDIPEERWFTNLEKVGNVGSASIYLMLDDFMKSGQCREGDTILCYIPESGRFSTGFMKLTAVGPNDGMVKDK